MKCLEETGEGERLFRNNLVIPHVVQRASDGGGSFLLAFLTVLYKLRNRNKQ